MTSWQTAGVCLVLRATRKRGYQTAQRGRDRMAHPSPPSPPPAHLRERMSTTRIGNHAVDRVHAMSSAAPGVVVYFHGGAFINGIAPQHWQLISYLTEFTGRDVVVPHYGRAPRHNAAEARDLLRALHESLRPEGPLHLAGDSAGGNLAMLMAQMHAQRGTVTGLTLIAPWLDLAMANPGIATVAPRDPWLTRAGLVPIAAQWAGSYPVDAPEVSPLRGDLSHLPSTLVLVGSRDICLPDCQTLADRTATDGRVLVHVEEGSPHVYPLLPTPEGRLGRAQIAAHVSRTLP